MKYPQINHNRTPKTQVEWVLTDVGNHELLRSKPPIQDIESKPIINDEGQTYDEWRADLRRRENEELMEWLKAKFIAVVLGGLTFVLISPFIAVLIIPYLLFMVVKALSNGVSNDVQRESRSDVKERVTVTTTTTTTTTILN